MKFAIGTGTDCFVYDAEDRTRRPIPRLSAGLRDAYGITWSSERVYIGWRFPLIIEEYDKFLNPTERALVPTPGGEFQRRGTNCAAHQILHLDGKVLVSDTGYNRVCQHDVGSLECSRVLVPHEVSPDNAGEVCRHYNSLYAEPDHLWVLAHMHSQGLSRVLRFRRGGPGLEGLVFEGSVLAGIGAHNVFRTTSGGLAVCDSMRGRIVSLDPPGQVLYQGPPRDITRGVSRPGKALAVGMSELIEERELRAEGFGRLLLWRDGDMGKEPEVHDLGPGPVHEVRCLDLPDAAHWPNGVLCAS